jgi:hypothetical protein
VTSRTQQPSRTQVSCFIAVAMFFFMSSGLAGCGRNAGTVAGVSNAASGEGSQPIQLKCGDTIYRLNSDKIDGEVNGACERTKSSYEATMSSRSARVRFTCQDSKGHVVMSMLVREDLLDDYNGSCRQFTAAEAALPNSTSDKQPYFEVLRKFQAVTNQLTRQSVDEANVVWRQNRADKAALNQLVKVRGGSIEIAPEPQSASAEANGKP